MNANLILYSVSGLVLKKTLKYRSWVQFPCLNTLALLHQFESVCLHPKSVITDYYKTFLWSFIFGIFWKENCLIFFCCCWKRGLLLAHKLWKRTKESKSALQNWKKKRNQKYIIYIYIYIYIHSCVGMCVFLCRRERDRQTDRDRERIVQSKNHWYGLLSVRWFFRKPIDVLPFSL